MEKSKTKGKRGAGIKHLTLWEEVKHLRVEGTANFAAIYKRLDVELEKPLEERNYYLHIPVPKTRGRRVSLRVSSRLEALERAEEAVVELRVQLRQGVTISRMPVVEVVAKFLRHKKSRVRGHWEGKGEAGRKSITTERYGLIEGKLRNYLIPFLGARTDIRTISAGKWSGWEEWRREQVSNGNPKAVTIQNEMTTIREFWKWAMEHSYIPVSPTLPFHDENLIVDDKVSRDTWEAAEWKSFARKMSDWLKSMEVSSFDVYWDAFVAYQMLFFLANSGMRTGELAKARRKDIQFYERDMKDTYINEKEGSSIQINFKVDASINRKKGGSDYQFSFKKLCALVQVHPSTKTGAREVNAMGGIFARRVWEKSQHRKRDDFLFCHLDGRQFSTKDFWKQFKKMIAFTNENERCGKCFVPYSLRHLYATTRLQNGTSREALCQNMGVTEPYLRKHYSKYLIRLATADLMSMRQDIGLGGSMIREGDDFALTDEVTK